MNRALFCVGYSRDSDGFASSHRGGHRRCREELRLSAGWQARCGKGHQPCHSGGERQDDPHSQGHLSSRRVGCASVRDTTGARPPGGDATRFRRRQRQPGCALIQGDKSLKTTDVQIRGGRWTNPEHHWVGRVFTILGDRWTIDSVQVDSWGTPSQGSICISVLGNGIVIRNCRAVGSSGREGQAGMRIESGKNIRVSDCYIESGDDTFCAFPTERAGSFGAGLPIEDVVFERCRGKSFKARFLACGLTAVNSLVKKNASLADLNNVSVSHISFLDCHGESVCEKPFAPAFSLSSAPIPSVVQPCMTWSFNTLDMVRRGRRTGGCRISSGRSSNRYNGLVSTSAPR